MKTIKILILLALLLPHVSVRSQSWQDELLGYFEALRTNRFAPIPNTVLSYPDHATTLAHLVTFLDDSSSAVRVKACEMIYRVAEKRADSGIQETAVRSLVSACAQGNAEVTGVALNYLKNFHREAFTSSSREVIKSLLFSDYSHLAELIRLIGFLQLSDLIPKLKSFAGPANRPAVRWAALISLVRLGDEEATDQMMTRVRRLPVNDDIVYNLFPDLIFSRSREAISHMVGVVHSESNDCLSADAERQVMIPCGYRVMEQLAPIIKDFPLKPDSSGDLNTTDYPAALQQIREWFLLNKHYVIIDETY